AGRKILLDLVRNSHIVVESFSPRVMPSLGLDYPAIEAVNPRGVMTSISKFGHNGPYRDSRRTEIPMYALGGTMQTTGMAGREPVKLALTVEEFFAGMVCATATMGAFLGSKVHGLGQHLDLSLFEIMVGSQDRAVQAHTTFQYPGVANTAR